MTSVIVYDAEMLGLLLANSELYSCSEFYAEEESLDVINIGKLPRKSRICLMKAVIVRCCFVCSMWRRVMT